MGAAARPLRNRPADPRIELANRLFFRLYQSANMLHKTGSRALEDEGLTTQQWAVLGAVSRPEAAAGMTVNELARYLMVSRQNLSGVLARMERDGHIDGEPDPNDRRARRIRMTPAGRDLWERRALPKIHDYYAAAVDGLSADDLTHALHYVLRILDNFATIDAASIDDRGRS